MLNPIPGSNAAQVLANGANSTTVMYAWSAWGQILGYTSNGLVPSIQISAPNGAFVSYTYSKTYGSPTLTLAPASTKLMSNSSATTYTYYHVNGYGYPTVAFATGTYNLLQRPWYYPAMNSGGQAIWTAPYLSPFSGFSIYALAQQYKTSTGKTGVVQVGLTLDFLSNYLAGLNTAGSSQVAYIMTTTNPAGLLLATTTKEYCGVNTSAVSAKNPTIAASAKYIVSNNIVTNTQAYVPSLGCYLTVKFWTYGSPSSTISVPPSYSTSISPSVSTLGLAWTIVSCNFEATPTTTYTQSSPPKVSPTSLTVNSTCAVNTDLATAVSVR